MPTLETRFVSGKGVVILDVDADDYAQAKVITVFAEVIRPPTNKYANYNYNPERSRYANLVFLRDGYVVRVEPMEFERQSWTTAPDISAQSLYAIECAYAGILLSFANLGAALGVVPVSVTNQIENWEHTILFFDTIKIVCYADTAIKVVVESNAYDLCPEQSDKRGDPPPPPPPPPTKYPAGTPLSDTDTPTSEPYEGENDNGDTVPYPGDAYEPPPIPGRTCVIRTVEWTLIRDGITTLSFTTRVFGDVIDARVNDDASGAGIQAYGSPDFGAGECELNPTFTGVIGGSTPGRYSSPEIVSITPPQ